MDDGSDSPLYRREKTVKGEENRDREKTKSRAALHNGEMRTLSQLLE